MKQFRCSVQKLFFWTVVTGVVILGTYFILAPFNNTPKFVVYKHRHVHLRSAKAGLQHQPLEKSLLSSWPLSKKQSGKAVHYPKFHKAKRRTLNLKARSDLDPRKRYLVTGFLGGLGNVMFELATAYCIARLNNLTLVANEAPQLEELDYQGIIVRERFHKALAKLRIQDHFMPLCCTFKSSVMSLNSATHSHFLHGYVQSWKYFEPCKTEMKQALLFKDHIIKQATRTVAYLRKKFPHRILVAVHVRMEDYLRPRAVANGKKVAPPEYYRRAMTYFRSYFRNVNFVVITSNTSWFRKEVTNASDVLVLKRTDSPAVDMEVLSRMDHVIFSVGTFGWWIAYKSNGTVLYYKDFFVPDSRYGKEMGNNASDYIYPGWVPL